MMLALTILVCPYPSFPLSLHRNVFNQWQYKIIQFVMREDKSSIPMDSILWVGAYTIHFSILLAELNKVDLSVEDDPVKNMLE